MPPAKNWLRFSGSIPPLFVLSPNMPTINTPSKLASFWRFCNAVGSLPCDSLATVLPPRLTLHPHASRPTPYQRGQVVRRPSPAGYCHPPTSELGKTERAPISTSGPSISSMSPNRPIASIKSDFSSPLSATRPLTIRTRPEALNARGPRRAGRMPVRRSARSRLVAQENTVHGRTDRILGV